MDEKYNCMPWLFFFLLLLQVNKTHHSEDEMPQVSFFTGRNKASCSTVDLPSSSSAQSSTKETTLNSISGAEEKVTLSLDTPPCEQRARVNPGEWFFVVAIAAINCNNKTLKPACFLLNLALEIHKFWKHTRHLYLTRENCTPYWCNLFFFIVHSYVYEVWSITRLHNWRICLIKKSLQEINSTKNAQN